MITWKFLMGITVTVSEDSVVMAPMHIHSLFVQVVETCWFASDQTSCLGAMNVDLSSHSQQRMKPVS